MNRRTAIKNTAYASVYTIFFSHLLACKSGDKVAVKEVEKAIEKMNLSLPADAAFKIILQEILFTRILLTG